MGLQGTLDTMPLEDLLEWMSRRRSAGKLSVQGGTVYKSLTLDGGLVVNAASNDPREYLGQYLINFGLITEDQLQKAFETQQETGVMLGRILVMTGMLKEDQIQRMLELKIRETVLDAFLWRKARFTFQDESPVRGATDISARVDLSNLCTEGVARRQRLKEIRLIIPDNQVRFQVLAVPAGLDHRSVHGIMLELARQGNSVADIILKFHSLDFPILNNLYEMVKKGWLSTGAKRAPEPADLCDIDLEVIEPTPTTDPATHPGPRPAPRPAPRIEPPPSSGAPDDFLHRVEGLLKGRDYQGALAVLKKGLEAHPYDPDLCQATEIAEKGLVEQLKSTLLADKRVPYLLRDDVVFSGLELSPAQRYIISRIDGRRSVRSIVMVSPLKEVDALLNFQHLIKSGIVALR